MQAQAIGGHLKEDPPATKGDKPWRHFAWTVILTHDGRSESFDYRCGTGHAERKFFHSVWGAKQRGFTVEDGPRTDWYFKPKPPTADDVLTSLVMDCQGYDNTRTFEDWASEYGYDEDSRKAEAIYRTLGEEAKKVRRLLGADYSRVLEMDEDQLRAWVAGPREEAV